ncbi:MAG: addiction module component CHP02574 family protein [Cytophagales bacterium]|nr:addiction module component CHP02574 family protein [Cytophagales bacterium]
MRLQVIQDGEGNNAGVFIPMEDWTLIKNQYPDIENIDSDLPQWEKDLIDTRLDAIAKNPERLKSGKDLLQELKRKI